MTAETTFEAERHRLLMVAYRIVGVWGDAEDIVQETWLRWSAADHSRIERPAAWLTTVATRLAIDSLRSARHQRETYVGPWLPEPIDTTAGPEQITELADTLTFGFLVALEQLTPVDRAVFVLREVFDVPFAEIADVVDKSEANCRQIAKRARERVNEDRPVSHSGGNGSVQMLLNACMGAAMMGDVDALEKLFADDVLLISDGGPNRHAARRPIIGPQRVTRFVSVIAGRLSADVGANFVEVNGKPGVVLTEDGQPMLSLTIEPNATHDLVRRIWIVLNPDKLAAITNPPFAGR